MAPEALRFTEPVPPKHSTLLGVAVNTGCGYTVNWLVVLQPLLALYVMVLFPALTPVTKPPADMVATAGFELDHDPGVTTLANCEVNPRQAERVPVMG